MINVLPLLLLSIAHPPPPISSDWSGLLPCDRDQPSLMTVTMLTVWLIGLALQLSGVAV